MLAPDFPEGPIRVAKIVPNGPASREGLEVGDLLLEIDGLSVLDQPLDKIMTVVRGQAGTAVELVGIFFF